VSVWLNLKAPLFQNRVPDSYRILAVDQEFEKSGMHLFWVYQHFDSPEFDLINDRLKHVGVPLDGFDLFYSGGRIYF
jgi:hypothetical protein